MEMKEMGFMFLVILVSINAIAEFAQTDAVLGKSTGFSSMGDFNATSIQDSIKDINTSASNAIEATARTDIGSLLQSLWQLFTLPFTILWKFLFGWSEILFAVFNSIGMPELAFVFIAPIGIIELITILYLLRDLVAVVRGVT